MRKPEYKRCPRCELNFIKKSEKLCSVCQAELNSKGSYVSDLDLELCPVCKINYIQPGEIMCPTCLKEHQNEDGELSEDWEMYANREEDDDYVDPDEETGGMASITDDPDELISGGYDDSGLDDFDDEDLGEMPEEIDEDDIDADEEYSDEEKEDEDDDEDYIDDDEDDEDDDDDEDDEDEDDDDF